MIQIFTLRGERTLADTISQLHDGDLAQIFGRTILNRAYDYVENVDALELQPGVATAEVDGSELYELTIEHRLGAVYGECSCPYEAACKHLAALLMHLRDHLDRKQLAVINPLIIKTMDTKPKSAVFDFDRHLETLSVEELRILVRQFAPESYRQTLAAQHAAPKAQDQLWKNADKKVRDLFKKAEQYGPEDFDTELVKRLEGVRAFWISHTPAVTRLLHDCILALDEAQEEGYLYDGYSDGVFDGEEFGGYLATFAAAQPTEKILIVVQSLAEALADGEFAISANFLPDLMPLLSDIKRRAVLPLFLHTDILAGIGDHHQRVVWQHFQPVLNTDEQKQLLSKLTGNQFFILALVDLYEQTGQVDQAIQLLNDTLAQTSPRHLLSVYTRYAFSSDKGKLFERRIELEHQHRQGLELTHWATRYIKETATAQSLHFALSHLPKQQKELEKLLQKANLEAFARYLEDQKRLEEVVKLFKKDANKPTFEFRYNFYKRHKKQTTGHF